MHRLGRVLLLAGVALVVACVPASAGAARFRPGGFRLQSSRLFVHENAGWAVVTILRGNVRPEAQIRYVTIGMLAGAHVDFVPLKAMIDFLPGQASASFRIRIIDHGAQTLPKTIRVALFGASPIGLARPNRAVLTIINDDPPMARNPGDPLDLAGAPQNGDPLAGARFFVDRKWGSAARLARAWRHSNPAASRMLEVIAREPGTQRFGNWGPHPGRDASEFLARASVEEPGTIPLLATYYLVDPGDCRLGTDTPAEAAQYHGWIEDFAHGIGDYRAVLFLEMDSIITTPCLSAHGLAVRTHELRDAINVLTANCPGLVIYLDGGAADALRARDTARLLRRAGVAKIQGFFLNSTHFDWTSKEIRYGEQVSRMTGGKHFVVNTGENGQGPLVPANRVLDGNEVLCNPPGRGLGPKPATHTGYRNVDAFAWTSDPGETAGACVPGAPATGYWAAYALMLVRDADFRVR
jgi:endoglucanase